MAAQKKNKKVIIIVAILIIALGMFLLRPILFDSKPTIPEVNTDDSMKKTPVDRDAAAYLFLTLAVLNV